MIKVENLTRSYGDFLAVDAVDFSIDVGQVVGLLGHNGAGKTTIMKMLSGFLEPSAGRILVDGLDVADQPEAVQAMLGYLPENVPLYPEMTVVDYLEYAAELRGVANAQRADAVRYAVASTDLGDKAFSRIDTLSRGYRQRVGVAQALLHKPSLLILDEPTSGLDPGQTQHMRDLIRSLADRATVILSTHIMQEVSAICDRVMILRDGRLVLDEELATLQRSQRLALVTDADRDRVDVLLAGVPGVGEVSEQQGADDLHHLFMMIDGNERIAAEVARTLVGGGVNVFSLAPEQHDLEAVFRDANEVPA
ncbi:MAG: ABC transporter ATP-binding protein [Gammaproteobacteria bacterium]|nr:MAG: ABC transporter ATP-binding protein [Gammaproteobacteria bacterium]